MTDNNSTALITGGTSRIGLATAKKLAQLCIHVLVVGRNAERGKKAVEEIGPRRQTMRVAAIVLGALAVLICGGLSSPTTSQTSNTSHPEKAKVAATTPLILESEEGERRVLRGWPGHPEPGETIILKVDPKNGGSKRLVLFTANIGPGGAIDAHRHPHADEILYFTSGEARVHVGNLVRDVHAGSTVFIPAGTWISASNIGPDPIGAVAIFSAPGFEDFVRDSSVREGEKNVPLSKTENDKLMKAHTDAVIYEGP